jgi:hypothetical protein
VFYAVYDPSGADKVDLGKNHEVHGFTDSKARDRWVYQHRGHSKKARAAFSDDKNVTNALLVLDKAGITRLLPNYRYKNYYQHP